MLFLVIVKVNVSKVPTLLNVGLLCVVKGSLCMPAVTPWVLPLMRVVMSTGVGGMIRELTAELVSMADDTEMTGCVDDLNVSQLASNFCTLAS